MTRLHEQGVKLREVKAGDPIRASDYNALIQVARAVGQTNRITGHGFRGLPWWDKLPWNLIKLAPDQFRITAGTLSLEGDIVIDTAETDLSLTGATEYIYVTHTRNSSVATITHAASRPESDATTLIVRLYKLEANGSNWFLADSGDLRFEKCFDLPTR